MANTARKRTETESTAKTQPSREGKVQIKTWADAAVRKRFKALAVHLEIPVETLLLQQIEVLLKKHGF